MRKPLCIVHLYITDTFCGIVGPLCTDLTVTFFVDLMKKSVLKFQSKWGWFLQMNKAKVLVLSEFKDISTKEKYWIRKTKTVLTSYSILLIIYSFLYICYLFICLRHHSLFFEKPTFNTTLKPIATITIHLFTNNHR